MHKKITNFKHLSKLLSKNRFLVWDNFTKENLEKEKEAKNGSTVQFENSQKQNKDEEEENGNEEFENIARNYSFAQIKNSILEL